MRDEFIWVVGGGLLQLPIIEEAVQRGYKVIVSDQNPDCTGAKLANRFINLDTYDWRGHVTALLSIQPEITPLAGIVTDAADVGPTVSIMAEIAGLPAASFRSALIARDKVMARTALDDHDIPAFLYARPTAFKDVSAKTLNQWKRKAKKEGFAPFPCVLKPEDNCASRGVSIAQDEDEFYKSWVNAYLERKDGDLIVIEEALQGPEYAVDFFVLDGNIWPVNASLRLFDPDRFGLETGHINPFVPSREAVQMAQRAAVALGVTEGPFKVDFLHDTEYNRPFIIETATRWSGGFDHTHTAVMSRGINLPALLLDYATGNDAAIFDKLPNLALTPDTKFGQVACAYAPQYSPGRIRGWGIPPAHTDQIIIRNNSYIPTPVSCADRPLFILALGDTSDEALANAKAVARKIAPIKIPGGLTNA